MLRSPGEKGEEKSPANNGCVWPRENGSVGDEARRCRSRLGLFSMDSLFLGLGHGTVKSPRSFPRSPISPVPGVLCVPTETSQEAGEVPKAFALWVSLVRRASRRLALPFLRISRPLFAFLLRLSGREVPPRVAGKPVMRRNIWKEHEVLRPPASPFCRLPCFPVQCEMA